MQVKTKVSNRNFILRRINTKTTFEGIKRLLSAQPRHKNEKSLGDPKNTEEKIEQHLEQFQRQRTRTIYQGGTESNVDPLQTITKDPYHTINYQEPSRTNVTCKFLHNLSCCFVLLL